jgi:hypothetical protein
VFGGSTRRLRQHGHDGMLQVEARRVSSLLIGGGPGLV